jgi:hypothetical protein
VLLVCKALGIVRAQLGVTDFVTECEAEDIDSETVYKYYVGGFTAEGVLISSKDYFQRGATLKKVHDKWLA